MPSQERRRTAHGAAWRDQGVYKHPMCGTSTLQWGVVATHRGFPSLRESSLAGAKMLLRCEAGLYQENSQENLQEGRGEGRNHLILVLPVGIEG